MEEPPLIDVEPEDGGGNRVSKFLGCFFKILPIVTIALALLIGGLWVAFFMLGDKDGAAKNTTSTGETVPTIDKSPVPGEAEENPTTETSPTDPDTSPVPESETPEVNEEPAAPMAEENSAEEVAAETPEATENRPGSSGSEVAASTQGDTVYNVARGDFAGAGNNLRYEVIYLVQGDELLFRSFVIPYDPRIARLFQSDQGSLSLTFLDESGEQVLPAEGVFTKPLSELTAYENKGEVGGWVSRGAIPLGDADPDAIVSVKMAWEFDPELDAVLRQIAEEKNSGGF